MFLYIFLLFIPSIFVFVSLLFIPSIFVFVYVSLLFCFFYSVRVCRRQPLVHPIVKDLTCNATKLKMIFLLWIKKNIDSKCIALFLYILKPAILPSFEIFHILYFYDKTKNKNSMDFDFLHCRFCQTKILYFHRSWNIDRNSIAILKEL